MGSVALHFTLWLTILLKNILRSCLLSIILYGQISSLIQWSDGQLHRRQSYLLKLILLKVSMSTICRLVSLVSKSLLNFTACSICSWLVVLGKDWKYIDKMYSLFQDSTVQTLCTSRNQEKSSMFSCSSLQFNIWYVVVTFFPGKYWSSFVLCTLPYLSRHKNKGKLKFNWK